MTEPPRTSPATRSPLAHIALLGAAVGLVALPALAALLHARQELADPLARTELLAALEPSPRLLAQSLAWAMAIAVVACVLAWPAALAARGAGWLSGPHAWRIAALLVAPLFMPNYLAFHALGVLRDPSYALGSALVRASDHWRDLPILLSQALAILGLALWAWPIACMVLSAALSRVDDAVFDHLRLDAAPFHARQRVLLSLSRGAIVRALALVTLIMLGSAVPLHLSQSPTYAALAWQQVTLHPTSARALVAAWPTMAIALAAALLCARRWTDSGPPAEPTSLRSGAPWPLIVIAAGSTLLPVSLEAFTLRSVDSLGAFWRVSAPAIAQSAAIACAVGIVCALIALLAMREARAPSWQFRVALALLLVGALTPGLLVGHAWALAVRSPVLDLLDGPPVVVLAHVSRVGALAALGGLWVARTEPKALYDLRALDAGERGVRAVRAWWLAMALPRLGALGAIAIACACLSLHEVEAAIVLQSPGLKSLAQTVLAQLHFARQEELAAATIQVVSPAILAALVAAALFVRSARPGPSPTIPANKAGGPA